jgi:hypothetical protein
MFSISTLTHNDIKRDVYLKNTIDSFIENTTYEGKIDWFIHCNGKSDLIFDVVTNAMTLYSDRVNFHYSFSEINKGVGAGINHLNNLTKKYRYTLFLEGDWICLPPKISGHTNWLQDCINYLEQNNHISQVLLRRYISDLDDRMYGYGYWIREDNIKNVVRMDNEYVELVKKEYTNNPHIRRNDDFYSVGIFPLNEYYDEDGNPIELKGKSMWGQAEIQAESKGYKINTSYLAFGNMVHCEHWSYYGKYNELKDNAQTCMKYKNTGYLGCKYGYFFPDKKFCEVCDHSKNFSDLERHEQEYESKL